MIVVDASAVANALTDDDRLGVLAREELGRDLHWSAPHHLVVEVFSALRGRVLGRKLTERRALDALDSLTSSAIELVPVAPLVARMWELRPNLSGYDAAYVALAEVYGCSLVTADARLARAVGLRCDVRLAVPRAGP